MTPQKGKKRRTNFTKVQIEAMEKYYKGNPYVSYADAQNLGKSLGLSEENVKVWFKNRRSKDKKKRHTSLPLARTAEHVFVPQNLSFQGEQDPFFLQAYGQTPSGPYASVPGYVTSVGGASAWNPAEINLALLNSGASDNLSRFGQPYGNAVSSFNNSIDNSANFVDQYFVNNHNSDYSGLMSNNGDRLINNNIIHNIANSNNNNMKYLYLTDPMQGHLDRTGYDSNLLLPLQSTENAERLQWQRVPVSNPGPTAAFPSRFHPGVQYRPTLHTSQTLAGVSRRTGFSDPTEVLRKDLRASLLQSTAPRADALNHTNSLNQMNPILNQSNLLNQFDPQIPLDSFNPSDQSYVLDSATAESVEDFLFLSSCRPPAASTPQSGSVQYNQYNGVQAPRPPSRQCSLQYQQQQQQQQQQQYQQNPQYQQQENHSRQSPLLFYPVCSTPGSAFSS